MSSRIGVDVGGHLPTLSALTKPSGIEAAENPSTPREPHRAGRRWNGSTAQAISHTRSMRWTFYSGTTVAPCAPGAKVRARGLARHGSFRECCTHAAGSAPLVRLLLPAPGTAGAAQPSTRIRAHALHGQVLLPIQNSPPVGVLRELQSKHSRYSRLPVARLCEPPPRAILATLDSEEIPDADISPVERDSSRIQGIRADEYHRGHAYLRPKVGEYLRNLEDFLRPSEFPPACTSAIQRGHHDGARRSNQLRPHDSFRACRRDCKRSGFRPAGRYHNIISIDVGTSATWRSL